MGIGPIGRPDVIIKRKFRWTLEVAIPCASSGNNGYIPAWPVKVAARPKITNDPYEINFLNQTSWLPGKSKWEPITITYIDVAGNALLGLWNWILSVYNFQSINVTQSEKAGWNGVARLVMYDGCGTALEEWQLYSAWPESVDWGELDYASNEEATITLSLRYSDVRYINRCGSSQPVGCCAGC